MRITCRIRWVVLALFLAWPFATRAAQIGAEGQPFIFAVVTKEPKDRSVVTAQVSDEGIVSEANLLPIDSVLTNTVWRNLEICHSLKADVRKVPDGYEVLAVRALDASMLPMSLQSIAGDCLIKKAIEVAPLVD